MHVQFSNTASCEGGRVQSAAECQPLNMTANGCSSGFLSTDNWTVRITEGHLIPLPSTIAMSRQVAIATHAAHIQYTHTASSRLGAAGPTGGEVDVAIHPTHWLKHG